MSEVVSEINENIEDLKLTEYTEYKELKDEEEEKSQSDDDNSEYSLNNIPTEVFLHICSFIEAGFLLRVVKLVSKQFYFILSNEKTWQIRQTKRWGFNGIYPPVSVDEDNFCWSAACIKREEQIKLWGNNGANLRGVELHSHIACVNAVHLFQGGRFLASGARDRALIIWDVENCFKDPKPLPLDTSTAASGTDPPSVSLDGMANNKSRVHMNDKAHAGWIWNFASDSQYLLSAGWDAKVKVWDMHNNFEFVTELSTNVACLCLGINSNLIACGTFSSKVLFFDLRCAYEKIRVYEGHKKSVLALGIDENYLISCGEDYLISCFDLRAGKLFKSVSLTNGAYPTCLSFRKEDPASLFYIGDVHGQVHLVDCVQFEIVKDYQVGHKRPIRGIYHNLGSVMSCASDGLLKIYEPSSGLNEVSSIKINAELPGVHSLNNSVALAGGDGIVRLWSPVVGF